MAKKETTPQHMFRFPAEVFVWEEGGDDPYLSVGDTADGANDGTVIGVYELRETRTKRIKHELA